MKVIKAEVMGVCEGVKLALHKTINTRKNIDEDIYLLGNLVHNEILMDYIKQKDIKILKEGSLEERINSINHGIVIFSAHGHDEALDELAIKKGLNVIDTTCPKVKLTMNKIKDQLSKNNPVIYIGVNNHPEANAILSISNEIIFIDYKNVKIPKILLKKPYVFNQTTLSILEIEYIHKLLLDIYPDAIIENDICSATTKRQKSLLNIDENIHYVLIIGDISSSNTLRLVELCKNKYKDKEILFVSCLDDLKQYNLDNSKSIFVTAGASTPDITIDPIIFYLENL